MFAESREEEDRSVFPFVAGDEVGVYPGLDEFGRFI